jgi:hypothetical protein
MSNDGAGSHDDPWAVLEEAIHRSSREPAPPNGTAKLGKRKRIVLAKRRSRLGVVRTLAELEDQTGVGEMLVRELVRVQLALAIRLMLITMVVLGSIPLAFLLAPSLGTISVLGLWLPWLLLGLVVYPFFVAVAWSYNRRVDRNEQEFTETVEN